MATVDSSEIKTELQDLLRYTAQLKRKYHALYDGSPDLLRTINTDGIIIDCNKSYSEHLGYAKKELVGTSIFDTVAEKSLQAMRNSFDAWKKTGSVRNIEVWFKRKDGTTFPALINANSLYDEDEKLIGSNTVIRDISDIYESREKIHNYQLELQKKIQDMKKQSAEKDEFVNMLTHEVKSTSIQITNLAKTLSSLQLGTLNGDQQEKLENIQFKSRSIIKMLSDIFYMQKIEEGQLVLVKNDYNLSLLVNGAIAKVKDDADSHGSVITTELQHDLTCTCDKEKIEHVLIQIIFNAIDFSPKGDSWIRIKLSKQDDCAKIVVKDNGVGIKADKLNKIFEKFYQLDTSILRESGGAGLGLSICKGIVEAHGGKIWAESEGLGMGAEIHILLLLTNENLSKIKKIE